MKDVENILVSLKSRVALTGEERTALRARVQKAMQARAVTFTPATRPLSREESGKGQLSALFERFITGLANNYRMTALAIALILALSGGGAAYAAQGALPGDVLYPVKINLDENIQQALAFSDQAKANVNASLAAERLKEAATLAAEGNLSTSTADTLQQNLDQHLSQVSAHLAKLSAEGNAAAIANVNAHVESDLSAYASALATLQTNAKVGTTTRDSVAMFVSGLKSREADAAASTTAAFDALDNATTTVSAQDLASAHDSAAADLTQAENAFANASSTLSVGAQQSISAHIKNAGEQLTNGESQAAEGHAVAAFALYQNSMRSSLSAFDEVNAGMTVQSTLRISGNEDESENEATSSNETEHGNEHGNGSAATSSEGNGHGEGENGSHGSSGSSSESEHGSATSSVHVPEGEGGANLNVNGSTNTGTGSSVNVQGGVNVGGGLGGDN
ncbi:MAG: hypothetical protein KGI73_01275 [Patescibacteria group bacterium]|nr:hypothetical protein [Patescibacteria group bacterium]